MMNGKVVIVTGATNGIGQVAAQEIAAQGATVVLISRSQSKLESTVQAIKSATGNPNVTYIRADLSHMAQVKQAAETFLSQHDRLDVLLNNAGGWFSERKLSADGYEMTLALNHLNYFLLTTSLLDVLKQTAAQYGEARIVNVSSGSHYQGQANFANIQVENNYGIGNTAYSESKLMNVMFTYALDRRLQGTGVTANVLHPGFVNTGFGSSDNRLVTFFANIAKSLFAKPPQQGAETPVYLATSPEVEGISGKYWDNKQQKRSSKVSYDQAKQEQLWQISEDLVQKAL
jgi:NAD(P)-dependent dehydrogenase (short-subunit alcohol dehydrogenase family)